MIWNKSCQRGWSNSTQKNISMIEIESIARNTVPVLTHKALMYYHKGLTCWDFLLKGKKLTLGGWLSQFVTRKSEEDASSEEEGKCLESEAYGESEWSHEGVSAVNLESNLIAEAAKAADDGSFWGLWVFLLCLGILVWIEIDCIVLSWRNVILWHKMHYGMLFGVTFRGDNGREKGGKQREAVSLFYIVVG